MYIKATASSSCKSTKRINSNQLLYKHIKLYRECSVKGTHVLFTARSIQKLSLWENNIWVSNKVIPCYFLQPFINENMSLFLCCTYHIKPGSPCRTCQEGPVLFLTDLELSHCQGGCRLLLRSMQNAANIYLANSPPHMVEHNREAMTAIQMLEKDGKKS